VPRAITISWCRVETDEDAELNLVADVPPRPDLSPPGDILSIRTARSVASAWRIAQGQASSPSSTQREPRAGCLPSVTRRQSPSSMMISSIDVGLITAKIAVAD
jgi:hypothetical protein